jgi:hypothetical protein
MQVAAACGLTIKFFNRQDLGCAHNGHGYGKCDEAGCWNYRKPLDQVHMPEEIRAAIGRPGENYPGLGRSEVDALIVKTKEEYL